MARMIPSTSTKEDFNGSIGEEELFDILKKLPDEYTVFHSVDWNRKESGSIRWGEADYTIFDPKRGLLVIEVKSGEISCVDGRIIQTNTKTRQSQIINPMWQANRSKQTFRQILERALPEDKIYWIENAVWFTSINKKNVNGTMPLTYKDGNVLFKEDMDNPQHAVDKVFNFYSMHNNYTYTQEDTNTVIRSLSPEFNAVPSLSTIYFEQENCFVRMTKEQSYLLDYLEEQKIAAIQGGAGTGKTMLAVEKARRLSLNENVLFLCFNHLLLEHLRDTFGNEMQNVDFYNLNSMACKAMNKEVTEMEIIKYLNDYDKYFNGWKYKSIIIDEGQDFSEEQIELLSDIARLNDGSFYIFYDKNQLVQQRNSLSWASEIECRLVLSLNCRNTRSIAETSVAPLNVASIKMRQEVQGSKPNFYIVNTVDEVKNYVTQLIRKYTDEGIKKKQIVILTMKTIETSVLAGSKSVGPYPLSLSRKEKGIFFTTAKKFKGLESDIIIVIDIDDETFKNPETRRIFYVGTSRAKHYLDLIAILDTNQERILAERLTDNVQKNVRIAIMGGLKVKIAPKLKLD